MWSRPIGCRLGALADRRTQLCCWVFCHAACWHIADRCGQLAGRCKCYIQLASVQQATKYVKPVEAAAGRTDSGHELCTHHAHIAKRKTTLGHVLLLCTFAFILACITVMRSHLLALFHALLIN